MKVLYNASTSTQKFYPITGNGHQQVLVVLKLDGDHFTIVSDDITSKIHVMRIINPLETNSDKLFHSFNMEEISNKEQFNYIYNWFDNNFNYQDRHKGTSIDNA